MCLTSLAKKQTNNVVSPQNATELMEIRLLTIVEGICGSSSCNDKQAGGEKRLADHHLHPSSFQLNPLLSQLSLFLS